MTEVAQPTSMTAEEAHAAAAAEGLALVRADNATGFKGVYHQPGQQTFKAQLQHDGRRNALGTFATAEQAAAAEEEAIKGAIAVAPELTAAEEEEAIKATATPAVTSGGDGAATRRPL